MDSSGNQDKPNTEVSKKPDLNSSKNDSALGLPTLNETPKLSLKVSLLLPIKSLNTSASKKPYYIIIPAKEAEPKKKINNNIKEQNVITGTRIKK